MERKKTVIKDEMAIPVDPVEHTLVETLPSSPGIKEQNSQHSPLNEKEPIMKSEIRLSPKKN